uniref:Uncharacterized protein n=1 Tax=Timema cristinae TaxID=61476 RepID=A0A7R9H9Y6_TIMCR|nr:unnamed protein product [Timema cristinae]
MGSVLHQEISNVYMVLHGENSNVYMVLHGENSNVYKVLHGEKGEEERQPVCPVRGSSPWQHADIDLSVCSCAGGCCKRDTPWTNITDLIAS